jgi:hypothetical protein
MALAGFVLMQLSSQAAEVAQWDVFEATYKTAKVYQNPFMEVEVDVVFTHGEKKWVVPAFWAGGGTWKVRFAAPTQGEYQFRVQCTDKANTELNGKDQVLRVKAYTGDNPLVKHGAVGISGNKRHFAHADGTPFLWLADTWWKNLCKRMTWEGFQELTADRKAKGFSVVQIVCGQYPDEGFFEPRWENEGGMPYLKQDFTVVNPKYFEYSDRRLRHLFDAGIMPAIVGAWGRADCDGMKRIGVEGLKRHWRNLVARYGAYSPCWMLGGEIPEETKWGIGPWAEVARYLRKIDPYQRPVTAHTAHGRRGQSGDEVVIDFDMVGGNHDATIAVQPVTLGILTKAWATMPPMPVLVGETCYEGHMQQGFQDVQRHIFWMYMLNGAAGQTYGAAGIWHASVDGDPGVSGAFNGQVYDFTTWKEGMAYPGAAQIGLGKKLLEKYPWWRFEAHPEWAPGCYAAGIPGELRVIYLPRRNIYNWSGPEIQNLEAGVNWRLYYWDPVNAKRYDKGTAGFIEPAPQVLKGHSKPLLFADSFEGDKAAAWKDHGTPTRRENGKLIGGAGMVSVVGKIEGCDLMASVDANSNAEAGVILRFQNADNYLVGLYSPLLKSIFLHDRKNGQWGNQLGRVAVPDAGPRIHLAVAARGEHAVLELSDGKNRYQTPVVKVGNPPKGKAGLWLYQVGERQEFGKFEVSKANFEVPVKAAAESPKIVIANGKFTAPNVPSPQDWVLVMERVKP